MFEQFDDIVVKMFCGNYFEHLCFEDYNRYQMSW